MKRIKIIVLSLSLVLLSTLVFVGAANASSFKTGDSITVAAGETVDSMLFTAGNNINIAGTVNGDVYCAGQTITISGTVNGDVFCGGGTIIISGKVDGSVRLGGQTVTISGTIGNSATIGASDLIIEKTAVITRDLLGGTGNATINGTVGRDIVSGSSNMTINGTVSRNIDGDIEVLSVGSAGVIGGDLTYTSPSEPLITSGGKIIGTTTRTTPKNDSNNTAPLAVSFGMSVYVLVSAIIFALVIAVLIPRILNESAAVTLKTPGKTILTGLVSMVLVGIVIVALFLTFVGAPLAILTILAWAIISILSGSFAGYALGKKLLPKSKKPVVIMLAGVSILTVLSLLPIPIVNFVVSFITYLVGTGMVLIQAKKLFARKATTK